MSTERLALYPGSFDPLTNGHADVIRRSLRLADRVLVAVAYNPTHAKSGMFSVPERVELVREVFSGEPRVEVDAFTGLLVEFARRKGAQFIIRGLRTVSDFEYELQMAHTNRQLWSEMETVFLTPDLASSYTSSSLVRQIASLGGDVRPYVPPAVHRALMKHLGC